MTRCWSMTGTPWRVRRTSRPAARSRRACSARTSSCGAPATATLRGATSASTGARASHSAEITDAGVLAEGVKVYQPDPYGTGQGSTVTYTYRAHRPLTASLVKHGELSFGILLSVTPHDAVDSTAWMWMCMNYETDSSALEYQDRIFAQDRPILESQRPELLPLDLQAELHLRSDRTAIAYRRWLRELGVRTGAS